MEEEAIRRHMVGAYANVDVRVASEGDGSPEVAWGDTFFIHHDDKARFPFATIVTKDYGEFDNASNLNREGIFRLNIGVSKETIARLFPHETSHDFTALDKLMPHPIYAQNHWVCVLNPSAETFAALTQLLDEAYAIAVKRGAPRGKSTRSR